MSTTEVNDNRKSAEAQINRLVTSTAEPINSDSNKSIRVPRKKKERTGVLPIRKKYEKNTPSITEPSATACCERRQELLSASGKYIAPIIALVNGLTKNLSRADWEDT